MNEIIKQDGITLVVGDDRMVKIDNRSHDFFIITHMNETKRKNYFKFRRELCPYEVNLNENIDVRALIKNDIFSFIIEELSGKWYRTKGAVFCFELETDAVAFKLRWL